MPEDKKNSFKSEPQGDDFRERFMRDTFPNIKPPEGGYQFGDKVIHKNGIVYEIRGVEGNGNYVLEYTKDGKNVKIKASQDDFKDISATRDYVSASIREGRIGFKKVIGVQSPPTPKTEGLGQVADIGDKVQDGPKPPSRN